MKVTSAKLRTKQRKYIKAKIEGKSSQAAAKEAGYSDSTARHADREIGSRPAVRSAFIELMEKAGLTDEKLVMRLNEGIDAEETKFFQKDGEVTDSRNVIAHGERRAHLELAMKVKGHLVERREVTGKITLAEAVAASMGESSE